MQGIEPDIYGDIKTETVCKELRNLGCAQICVCICVYTWPTVG